MKDIEQLFREKARLTGDEYNAVMDKYRECDPRTGECWGASPKQYTDAQLNKAFNTTLEHEGHKYRLAIVEIDDEEYSRMYPEYFNDLWADSQHDIDRLYHYLMADGFTHKVIKVFRGAGF